MVKLETIKELEIMVELYRGLLAHRPIFRGEEIATESQPLFDIFPLEGRVIYYADWDRGGESVISV